MLTISLNNLRFFAYHGLYPDEKIAGAEFEVNVQISFPERAQIYEINETINYEEVFEIVKRRMDETTPLLETIAIEICNEISLKFPEIEEINITISKLKPPIPDFRGSVSVSYQKMYR